jgi:hypothetical protein
MATDDQKSRAAALAAGHKRIEWAVGRAVDEPCRIVLHDGGAATFIARLYGRLRDELSAGRIPVGQYLAEVMVGARRVSMVVTVQADLFGTISAVVDHAGLDGLTRAHGR